MQIFTKNLTGNVFYILTDGELKGFNIGGMALKAVVIILHSFQALFMTKFKAIKTAFLM